MPRFLTDAAKRTDIPRPTDIQYTANNTACPESNVSVKSYHAAICRYLLKCQTHLIPDHISVNGFRNTFIYKSNDFFLVCQQPEMVRIVSKPFAKRCSVSRFRSRKAYLFDFCDRVKIREFDTSKLKRILQSLETGLFFCQIFVFII